MDAGLLQRQHSLAYIESGAVKEFHTVMALSWPYDHHGDQLIDDHQSCNN